MFEKKKYVVTWTDIDGNEWKKVVWADQGNKNPLLRAFLRWCDSIEKGGME